MTFTIATETRDINSNLDQIRSVGKVPAVMYGAGTPSTPIMLSHKDTVKLYKQAGGSTIITLQTDKGQKSALIHDADIDPVSHQLRHIDFLIIDENKTLTLSIPLHFIGEAPAEKQGLGVLVKSVHEIEIEVPAKDLPPSLDVDLTSIITLEDNIYAKDIKIPVSAKLITHGDVIVATVSVVKEEAEGPTTIDFDSIAVEEKGKKDGEETEETVETKTEK